MNLEHKMIDGTAMVSYLRDRQSHLSIGSVARKEIEMAVIYIVGTLMKEEKMGNLDLYEKVRSVPDSAKKTIKGGRTSGMTDINPMWRIKVLTEQFGPCGIGWYYIPTRKWLETSGNEIAAFVDIELYIKVGGEWSKPIPGNGGSMFAAKEKSGIYVSDECYKMATTDAISVACKQLGIGADVYWNLTGLNTIGKKILI